MCGGSIVTNKYVLTAAHCYYMPDQLLIIAGSKDRTDGDKLSCHTSHNQGYGGNFT